MKRFISFFDLEGDGEIHVSDVEVGEATLLALQVDYDFPPEHEDFISETGDEGQPYFWLRVEGRIGTGKFLHVTTVCENAGRYIGTVDVRGLDEVRLVLGTEPPTNYPTGITVTGNLL